MGQRMAGGRAATPIDLGLAEPSRPQGVGGDEPSRTLTPVLTPHGALVLRSPDDGVPLPPGLGNELQAAFVRGPGHGLLALGADHVGAALPPVLSYWRELGVRYVTALCALPGLGDGGAQSAAKSAVPPPADDVLERMAAGAAPMPGAEYLTAAVLAGLWQGADAAFNAEQAEAGIPAQDFLKARNPAWNLVGRVHFNLAENRKDGAAPFDAVGSSAFRTC